MDQVLLSGPPGVGKTTTGRVLAGLLQREFFDLDEQITMRAGHTPAWILRERGEPELRTLEATLLRELPRSPAVMALGGGTLTTEPARTLARHRGFLVGLKASVPTLERRLREAPEPRPLLENGPSLDKTLERVIHERAGTYESVDRVCESEAAPEQVAARVHTALQGLEGLTCRLGTTTTRVVVGRGLCQAATGAVSSLDPRRPVVALLDAGVPEAARRRYLDSLEKSHDVWPHVLAGGEGCKNWTTLERVTEAALENGAGRQSVVFALGGGAVLDLAGLVASLLGRGAPLVLVPSTLLAQVDASIGGKCAINTRTGRNLVGAFHPATDVLCDLDLLQSVPAREIRSGLAEMIKIGLVADAELFRAIGADCWQDPKIVAQAIARKAEIVERDPEEHGERKLLNLGHTLAHGLEADSGYQIRHGEAVASGMAWIAGLSSQQVGLPEADRDTILRALEGLGLPTDLPPGMWGRLRPYILADKKGDTDGIELILLPKIGEARRCRVSWDELERQFVLQGG